MAVTVTVTMQGSRDLGWSRLRILRSTVIVTGSKSGASWPLAIVRTCCVGQALAGVAGLFPASNQHNIFDTDDLRRIVASEERLMNGDSKHKIPKDSKPQCHTAEMEANDWRWNKPAQKPCKGDRRVDEDNHFPLSNANTA